ncbi:regulatory protein RecX [Ciceribacter sp. L1K22]|nr:regulatory protein RecX [Ciceribacter sp. L1K22]
MYDNGSVDGEGRVDEQERDTDGDATPRMLAWAKNSAAYRLSRRMMSEHELAVAIRRKARQKFEAISERQVERLVETALQFGRQVGALDDTAYAEVKARSAARAGKSKRMITRKLSEKGIASTTIGEALHETDDLRAAVIFARKRALGPYRRVELDLQRRQKEFAAFARNGFAQDIARRVLIMEMDEAEVILLDGGQI